MALGKPPGRANSNVVLTPSFSQPQQSQNRTAREMMSSLSFQVIDGSGLKISYGQRTRGEHVGYRKNRSGTEERKRPTQSCDSSAGRPVTKTCNKDECSSQSSHSQQEEG